MVQKTEVHQPTDKEGLDHALAAIVAERNERVGQIYEGLTNLSKVLFELNEGRFSTMNVRHAVQFIPGNRLEQFLANGNPTNDKVKIECFTAADNSMILKIFADRELETERLVSLDIKIDGPRQINFEVAYDGKSTQMDVVPIIEDLQREPMGFIDDQFIKLELAQEAYSFAYSTVMKEMSILVDKVAPQRKANR